MLSKLELWCLEVVLESSEELGLLVSPYIGICLNQKTTPSLSSHEAAQVLHRLLKQELISIYSYSHSELDIPLFPSDVEIKEELEKPAFVNSNFESKERSFPTDRHPWYYQLTQKGGQCWERQAQPDWNKYINTAYPIEIQEAYWVGKSRDRIKQLIYSPYESCPPEPGSEVWEELCPFEATYWKMLPHGYRLTYHYQKEVLLWNQEPAWKEQWKIYCAERDTWFSKVNW